MSYSPEVTKTPVPSALAARVRAGRKQKNYTQQQLADLCGISLRSVQRIERAEVFPRDYTLNMLNATLGLTETQPHERLHAADLALEPSGFNRIQRIILSVGIGPIVLFFGLALVTQSRSFPETTFELAIYAASLLAIYMLTLLLVWRKNG